MQPSKWLPFKIEGDAKPVVVLASSSPNRLALLRQIGIEPLIELSGFAEDLPKTLEIRAYVEETASRKVEEVAERLRSQKRHFDVVIGCDTVITPDDRTIIGKPQTMTDALETLRLLSGKKHYVYTGVCLIDAEMKIEKFSERTEVVFGEMPDDFLVAYVGSGEAMGRAGSYAIQGRGAMLVRFVNGCFYNVVGLPLHELILRLMRILRETHT